MMRLCMALLPLTASLMICFRIVLSLVRPAAAAATVFSFVYHRHDLIAPPST